MLSPRPGAGPGPRRALLRGRRNDRVLGFPACVGVRARAWECVGVGARVLGDCVCSCSECAPPPQPQALSLQVLAPQVPSSWRGVRPAGSRRVLRLLPAVSGDACARSLVPPGSGSDKVVMSDPI